MDPFGSNMFHGIPVKVHVLDKQYEYLKVFVPTESPQVAIVALDRPRKRNAMNAAMWKEIGSVFTLLGTSGDGCRAILLVGNGPAFSAGIDVTDPTFLLMQSDTEDVAHTGLTFLSKLKEMQNCFTALENCPVPVVAAIHGKCIGGGIDLICSTDIRICSENSIFSVREVAIGLAADVGTLQRFPKIVGNQSIVRELCLTARDFSAQEAMKIGLLSRIVPENHVFQEGLKICIQISRHSPVAVRGTKKALLYSRDHTVADGLEQVGLYNALALQSNDVPHAWSAAMKKSTPKFADIPPHSKL